MFKNLIFEVLVSALLLRMPQDASSLNFIKKETLAKVFSCEFWEISKDTFYYRTPLVAAPDARNQ